MGRVKEFKKIEIAKSEDGVMSEDVKAPCGLSVKAFMALANAMSGASVSMRDLDVAVEIRAWLQAQSDALPKG